MESLKAQRGRGSNGTGSGARQNHPEPTACARGAGLFAPSRRFNPHDPELIDQPGLAPALLREELETLEYFNRHSGGHQLAIRCVRRLLRSAGDGLVNILDLGTGLADGPRALAGWFRRQHRPVTITAVDRNPDVLRLAREACRDWPEIRLEQHDLLALPYPPASFDLVLCSLALHHFATAEAITILHRMKALARAGYVVNDLRRNRLAIWLTDLLARTVIRSPIFGHDAMQSSRAAFTVGELRALAVQAGLKNFHLSRHQGVFRMVLTGTS